MIRAYSWIIFLSVFNVLSCGAQQPIHHETVRNWQDDKPNASSDLMYEVFLIGDSRQAYENVFFMEMMESHLSGAGKNSTVVFLGDNVQADGLPDSTHRQWEVAQKSLDAQMILLEDYKGEVFFLPGYHDWARGGRDGLDNIKNQRKYIENSLDRKNVFLPKKGRPGPEEIHLTNDIVLIIFDSQWWFHEHEKSYAGIVDEADIFVQIEDAISRNKDKKIIFASHHPLYSIGNYGGHFTAADNFFPLLKLNKALYIPLPGFFYTGFRKFLGGSQDLSNPHYKMLIEALHETFEGHSNILYAAGHEQNLQYVERDSIHHIVSGAAGIPSYVSQSNKADFAQMQEGFAKLIFYENGDVWLEFFTLAEGLTFRKMLFNKPVYEAKRIKQNLSEIDYSDSVISAYPNGEKYEAGALKRFFFGDLYRDEWLIPVDIPLFNFESEQGDLEIVKKGGGQQTTSLRLENDRGHQYVLRSIEKDPSNGIPEVVKMQLAVDIVGDQMAAYLPWAALSVPRLARASEIYHANPKIVYLTKDPRLGALIDDVPEGLYLFEERPNGDRRDVESFGFSKNIIGSPDMFDEITEDHDNQVDQYNFLKSRLFDVYIGDFDRHEDQWRWAGFKKDKKMVYRAVPRDRDQTFFLNEGLFPWISSRKFAYRINQGFDYQIKDLEGYISQARRLDRRFLNEPSKKDWIRAAEKMQANLTDELIIAAVNDMPPQITESMGAITVAKLQSRRDNLPVVAAEHYSILSKKVDVLGSNKREQFLVDRLNNNETEVKVWSLDSKGKKKDKLYDRKFKHDETSEIRLYGLKGKDEFDVKGKVNKGMKVRIIGGPGKDDIKDKSEVRGLSKRTIVYDTKKKNDIEFGTEARNRTSNMPEKNRYNYNAFNYNKFLPLAYFGFNTDEALILGVGFNYTRHGFQKSPYASNHSVGARYATATSAFELKYDGIFKSVIGGLDLNLHFIGRGPRFTQNYFGLGNETIKTSDDKDYNRVRIGQLHIYPELSKTFRNSTLYAGVFLQQFEVENTPERYISDIPDNGLSPDIFDQQRFTGLIVRYELDTRNHPVLPSRGVYWSTSTKLNYSLTESAKTHNQISSDLRFFLSFKKPNRMVIAFRLGGAINNGDYLFFQANSIGGEHNLRGHRNTRYSGDASIYQNTELRYKLFNFSTYFAKGEFGVLGFNDLGRVWLEGEDSNVLHQAFGGGLWMSAFRMAVLSANYEWSKDEPAGLYSFRFKFLF